jgi:uncharacterized protein
MRVLRALVFAAALVSAGALGPPLRAEEPANGAPKVTKEAVEAARELLMLMSHDMIIRLVGQVTTQMWPAIESRLRAYNKTLDAATLGDLRKELERIQADYMMNIVKEGPEIYARHFSASELREIIAFYRTPTGRKLLDTTPQLTADVSAMITPHMPEFYGRTMEVFVKALRSRGYAL